MWLPPSHTLLDQKLDPRVILIGYSPASSWPFIIKMALHLKWGCFLGLAVHFVRVLSKIICPSDIIFHDKFQFRWLNKKKYRKLIWLLINILKVLYLKPSKMKAVFYFTFVAKWTLPGLMSSNSLIKYAVLQRWRSVHRTNWQYKIPFSSMKNRVGRACVTSSSLSTFLITLVS